MPRLPLIIFMALLIWLSPVSGARTYIVDDDGFSNYKTIQDAIDFAVFAIQTTIDCVKFFPRAKTVGGPIDVLVINRERAFWVNREELKINIH